MAAPNPLPPSDAIQRLNIRDLPNNLHAAFKTECARRGRTMRGVIIAFLRDAVEHDPNNQVVNLGRLSRKYPEPR